ncbi:MAG: HAD-IIIA family hydrolase [Actinomycetota bacterium]|nr:HAD-IIIA family hydrolase [Actinomycetota bacterium]
MTAPSFDIVIPTLGRPSLAVLLRALATARGPRPERVLLVHDGPGGGPTLAAQESLCPELEVLVGSGAGPAAARNLGWRAASASWVAFLDDDVVPDADWLQRLAADLHELSAGMAATQGRLRVPLAADRRPTDWERNVAGLETARWATADMAYRQSALVEVGGFDERFPRPFREDADLALRVVAAGHGIEQGTRTVSHPVRPAGPWVSVRLQAGNADDALMRALHGRGWHQRAGAPAGRLPRHLATTASGVLGGVALLSGHRRLAALGALGWLAATAELAWARIAPGPRTRREVTTMVATSAVIPAAATYHRLRGELRWRRRQSLVSSSPKPDAVVFDRDGTLVADVAYNGDPDRVVLMPGAREAVDRLRSAGVPTAVVSNQSGVGRGVITMADVEAVNRRVEDLLGPLGPWIVCPHHPADGCQCRKPAPAMVLRAAEALGVAPCRCAVIGDIGADVQAARAAGARGVLVPTATTRTDEVAAAPEVATDLVSAVDLLLGGER